MTEEVKDTRNSTIPPTGSVIPTQSQVYIYYVYVVNLIVPAQNSNIKIIQLLDNRVYQISISNHKSWSLNCILLLDIIYAYGYVYEY